MKTTLFFLWMIISITAVLVGIGWRYIQVNQVVEAQAAIPFDLTKDKLVDVPQKLIISKLGVEMMVEPASVKGNDWGIFDQKASWLSTSGTLLSGNMVIYAHNNRSSFGELNQLEIGDEIVVENDQVRVLFAIKEMKEGKATDIQYVTQKEGRLTLYTCSGPLDTKRFFVMATVVRIEERL
jgi:LPXTG-site transpeptidase (sortase) family protein